MSYNFLFTNDGSAGLYNETVNDIYHSVFGARTEAWEKFVVPLNFDENFSSKKNLKVLDICFGIGYNTKAFIKKLLLADYKGCVKIDALEYDKNLVLISPFIKDGHFKVTPEISFILCSNFISQLYESKEDIFKILMNNTDKKYFEPFYRDLIKKYQNQGYTYDPKRKNKAFLHNIHYHCISTRIKNPHRRFKLRKFKITPYFDDARNTVKKLKGNYDIVFLDAFTPSKLPTLWSLEFFEELHRLCCDDSMLLTYSNSSAVRHAMIDAGFYVGKIFDRQKRPCGTAASKNPSYIKYPLNDYDIGLMNTNAGIYYKDENLNASSFEILEEHKKRKEKLCLESSSRYIKRFKTQKELINV